MSPYQPFKSEHLARMKQIADGFLEIPANEQCIGHMQVAIQEFMLACMAELERRGIGDD